jgi:predicted restriction endonuclease
MTAANPRRYRHTSRWRTTTRTAVLAKTGNRCAVCGWPGQDGKGKGIHLAHIIEPELGGSNEACNLLPLCPTHHRGYDAGKQRARRGGR